MATMRKIEVAIVRVDAHGEPTGSVVMEAKQVNGNVTLEFHGDRTYRFMMPVAVWETVKGL